MIRVLVCDDHAIVRQAIRQVLEDAPDIALGAQAENGPEAIRILRASTPDEPIHVVLMDIAMPHRDGLDVLRQIRSEFPKVPVLMLSLYPDKQYAIRSLKLGASGYLNKSADSRQMAEAIRKVMAGGLFITPVVADQLADAIATPHRSAPRAASPEPLSRRESEVMRLLADGRSVGEIAAHLALPAHAVRSDRARILEKTGARNDVELALYAVRAPQLPV